MDGLVRGKELPSANMPDALRRVIQDAASQHAGDFIEDAAFEAEARRRGLNLDGKTAVEPRKPTDIRATPYRWKDPNTLPKRQWVYDRNLVRKYLTVTVAPGGVGKSSLALVEGLALVTGRPLLGKTVEQPSRVWLVNLEDPHEELDLRIQAACEFHDISADDLGDRLFVDSGREQPICVAVTTRNRTVIQRPVVEQIVAELRRREVDVFIVDPFVSSHAASENDNTAMDMIAKEWSKVADAANCAIHLIHHTRKLGSDADVTAESSRGGKALTDAARVVRAINRMSKEEGEKFNVDNHREYFRAYNDKANMAPPAELSDWYRIHNVILPNGEHVGVVASWSPPSPFEDVKPDHLLQVQRAVHATECREDCRSKEWVGFVVAEVLGLDADDEGQKQKIKSIIKTWIKNKALKVRLVNNAARNKVKIVEVGQWADR